MTNSNLGAKVMYSLSETDVQAVMELQSEGKAVNPVQVGQQVPGIVTSDWGNGMPGAACNIIIFLDGQVVPQWRTSVSPGTVPGTFQFVY